MYKEVEGGFLSKHRPVIYSTDAVIITLPPAHIEGGQVSVIVHRRSNEREPYFNCLALPGGMVRTDEDSDDRAACERVIREKISMDVSFLEQLQTFSGAARDPRGWSSSVVYFTLVPWARLENWWSEKSPDVSLLPIGMIHKKTASLAFDHAEILQVAVARLNAKARYSSLPCLLLGERFTIKQMHSVYDAIKGKESNIATFRKKVLALDFLEEIPGAFELGPQRPAQLYELRQQTPVLFDRIL